MHKSCVNTEPYINHIRYAPRKILVWVVHKFRYFKQVVTVILYAGKILNLIFREAAKNSREVRIPPPTDHC